MGEAKTKLEIKKKMFENNPDAFIHADEVIMGVILKDDKVAVKMNLGDKAHLELAYANICGEYPFARAQAIQILKEREKSNIVIPDKA